MPIALWPHQVAALESVVRAERAGLQAGLWAMPTGTGKTRAFCTLARQWDARTLVVVHRHELVRQAAETLADVWPEARDVAFRGASDDWRQAKVCVATVQGLHPHVAGMPPGWFDLVVL